MHKMEPISVVLGGIVIAIVSGLVGKLIGGNKKVSDKTCNERQNSLSRILIEKIDNLTKNVDELKQTVNDKMR